MLKCVVRGRHLLAGVLACLLAGCAGREEAPLQPPPDRFDEPQGLILLRPEGAAAAAYRTGAGDLSDSAVARRIQARFPALTPSACLERAAAELARLEAAAMARVPLAGVEFLLHWAGCPDATAMLSVLETPRSGIEPMLAHLEELLPSASPVTHAGVARGASGRGERWVTLLVRRRFSLRDVATSVAPGGVLTLQFTLDSELRRPRIVSTLPGGWVRESAAGSSEGWSVAGVPLSQVRGEQWVEIVAEGGGGPEIVALFPVAVGREAAAEWEGQPLPDEGWITGREQAEELLLELINRDRVRVGLPALRGEPRLAAAARAHSEDMARRGFIGHVAPGGGDLTRRLAEAGYPGRAWGENLARAPSVAEAHEGLMRSPGHRANILSAAFTELGVGVVRGQERHGAPMWIVTEAFATPLVRVPPEELELALARAAGRAEATGDSLVARLDGLAREAAAAIATDPNAATRAAQAVIGRLDAGRFRSVRVLHGTAFAPADVRLPPEVLGPAPLGIGAAAPADSGEPLVYVLIIAQQ